MLRERRKGRRVRIEVDLSLADRFVARVGVQCRSAAIVSPNCVVVVVTCLRGAVRAISPGTEDSRGIRLPPCQRWSPLSALSICRISGIADWFDGHASAVPPLPVPGATAGPEN